MKPSTFEDALEVKFFDADSPARTHSRRRAGGPAVERAFSRTAVAEFGFWLTEFRVRFLVPFDPFSDSPFYNFSHLPIFVKIARRRSFQTET